jgi:hypothetical protein
LRQRAMFNLIEMNTAWKVDLVIGACQRV